MNRSFVLLLALSISGCAVHFTPPPSGTYRRQPQESAPPPVMTPAPRELQVKEVKAGVVRARVIYAKEVKAKDGRVGRIYRSREGRKGWGHSELKGSEVVAEVIYAKEVKADWLEADEIYAQEVKIGDERHGHHHDHDDD